MLSDGTSNESSVSYSNGSSKTAHQETEAGPSAVMNGGFKRAPLNGSTNGQKRPEQPTNYLGHNREEVTRLLIQALTDMGYQEAAENVCQKSGYQLESPTVTAFRSAVLAGSWAEAEQLLLGATAAEDHAAGGNGLILAPGSDKNLMRFWLRQQKFLELLEIRETGRALTTLRGELTPLYQETSKLHFLSSLLMCRSADELMLKANWDGAHGQSRKNLLSELSRCISPSVMLPENRLAILLQHVKQSQIDRCLYHTAATSPTLYSDHLCDRRDFPSEVCLELRELNAEVWQVLFSNDGTKLAACGKSENVLIWDTTTFKVILTLPDHDLDNDVPRGVCSVAWSPDDSMIVTCSFDKYARLWDAKTGALIKRLRRFEEPVSGCVWASDSKSFVLGSLGKNHALCTFFVDDEEILEWGKRHRVQELCGSPNDRYLVAVDDLQNIYVYDARTRELEYQIDVKSRPTSVSIARDSRQLLVNKQDGEAQIIDLGTKNTIQKFLGHTGGEYLIRAAFGGANESFVMSGSEDGNVLIWHRSTGTTVERLAAHHPRCNAVVWSPSDPNLLATCGDDERIKIWTNKTRSLEIRARHSRASNGWQAVHSD